MAKTTIRVAGPDDPLFAGGFTISSPGSVRRSMITSDESPGSTASSSENEETEEPSGAEEQPPQGVWISS